MLTAILVCAAGMGWTAPAALADGDPASDVLATQPLFVPADAGVPAATQAQLSAVVAAAARGGDPFRVAIVSSPADLGTVTALWRAPASYATYLGVELSLVFHGTLVVVMPDGFGVARVGGGTGPGGSALAGLHLVGTGLGQAAIIAVRRLAAAAGHPLSVPAPSSVAGSSPAGGGSWLSSVDLGSWLVLAAGLLVIGLAWNASLRARPPGGRVGRLVGRA